MVQGPAAPVFYFTAITPAGQTIHGTVSASSQNEAIAWIRAQGNLPVRAEAGGGHDRWRARFAALAACLPFHRR
ncbi:hypothetical protein, partial [Komagataeibacter kakiaceti]|uniref:hypothetical protein n=1 Tax=Komagataeibacter kakiaceti TaxID=943261 RepID=UPI0005569621